MSFLKKQKLAARWIWTWSQKYKFCSAVFLGLSMLSSTILSKIIIFCPDNWTIRKLLFCSHLGAKNVEKAKEQLFYIEKNNCAPESESEIRFLYQALSIYCRETHNPLKCIDNYELRVTLFPNSMWAWRELAGLISCTGNTEATHAIHLRHVKARDNYAKTIGYDTTKERYFGPSHTFAIGHICMLGTTIKLKHLKGDEQKKNFLYINPQRVANPCLLSYMIPEFEVIPHNHPTLSEETVTNLEDPFMTCVFGEWKDSYTAWVEIETRWENEGRNPLFKLKQEHLNHGREQLKIVGVPSDAWFVTLHVREGAQGWLRNANILDYIPAIEEITKRGGWVIRIGDKTMTPLPPMKNVIDYAHSPIKSDQTDIFLIASCEFFIGTASGPGSVPGFFGKRFLQTNYAPLLGNIPYSKDILIPCIFRSKMTSTFMTFREMLASPLAQAEHPTTFKSDLEKIPNSPIEILEGVQEMFELIAADQTISPTKNQEQFIKICNELKIPFRPRISDKFLVRHPDLLN